MPFLGCPFSARKRDPTLGLEPLRLPSLPAGELGRRLLGGVRPTAAALRRTPLLGVTAPAVGGCSAAAAGPWPPERKSDNAAAPAAIRAPMADPPPDEPLPAPALRARSRCVELTRLLCRMGLAVVVLALESLMLSSCSCSINTCLHVRAQGVL